MLLPEAVDVLLAGLPLPLLLEIGLDLVGDLLLGLGDLRLVRLVERVDVGVGDDRGRELGQELVRAHTLLLRLGPQQPGLDELLERRLGERRAVLAALALQGTELIARRGLDLGAADRLAVDGGEGGVGALGARGPRRAEGEQEDAAQGQGPSIDRGIAFHDRSFTGPLRHSRRSARSTSGRSMSSAPAPAAASSGSNS